MGHVAEIVRKEIARLFAQSPGDTDEILNVQAALICFQPGQLRRRDPCAPRHVSLAASLSFPKLPQNASIHDNLPCIWLAN